MLPPRPTVVSLPVVLTGPDGTLLPEVIDPDQGDHGEAGTVRAGEGATRSHHVGDGLRALQQGREFLTDAAYYKPLTEDGRQIFGTAQISVSLLRRMAVATA